MADILTAFVFTSIAGTILALALLLLRPFTRRVFPPAWHYYSWLIVLLIMLLPVRFDLQSTNEWLQAPQTLNTVQEEEEASNPAKGLKETEIVEQTASYPSITKAFSRALQIVWSQHALTFSYIWFTVFLAILTVKLSCYIRFIHNVSKCSEPVPCPSIKEYTSRRVNVKTSETICSPILVGILSPTLLLPKMSLTAEQLHNILAHELTHLNRHDIPYKWFLSFVKCVHWFNPAIYMISKQITIDCEVSCDLAVVKDMSTQEQQKYMETILALLTNSTSKSVPLTTGMTGDKKTLMMRFTMIKNKKKISKKTYVCSGIVAFALLVVAFLASGAFAGFLPENASEAMKNNNTLSTEQSLDKQQLLSDTERLTDNMLSASNDNRNRKDNENRNNESDTYKSNEVLNANEKNSSGDANVLSQKSDSTGISKKSDDNFDIVEVNSESSQKVNDMQPDIKEALLSAKLIWPTESRKISNSFGTRVHPITNETSVHNGVDIAADEGSEVFSSIYGTVIEATFDADEGYYIIVENADGIRTQYSHLSTISVSVGDVVNQGNVIGNVGKTGKATGAHLHFSVKANGKYYNPQELAR